MAGAQDFMVVPAPSPQQWAGPQVDFSPLAKLPQNFYEGQQQARTLAIQNAFQNGVPMITGPDGQQIVDINSVMQTLAKAGATDQVIPLADASLRQQQYLYDRNSAPLLGGQSPSYAGPLRAFNPSSSSPATDTSAAVAPPLTKPVSNNNAAGPANIRGPQFQGGAPQASSPTQPTLSTFGADNNGADTLQSIVAGHYGGNNKMSPQAFQQTLQRIQTAFNVTDPNAALSPDRAQQIRSQLPSKLQPTQGTPVTGGGAPINPVGGTGGNGAPAPGTAPETAAPATGILPNGPAYGSDDAAYLQAHGIALNDRSLAAAKMFGAPAAASFLTGISRNPNAPAANLFDPQVVKANQSLFYDQNGKPVSAVQLFRNLSASAVRPSTQNAPVTPSAAVRNADPTFGGLVPADYPGGAPQYLNDMYRQAGGPMSPQMRQLFEDRIKAVQDALAKTGELTPGLREWLVGRQPGETQADYEARVAGVKEAAVAPYQIAAAAIREGGRPVTIAPNQVVTTGATVNPDLQNITNWASRRLGIPTGAPPAVPPNGQPSSTPNIQPNAAPPAQPPQSTNGQTPPNAPVTGQSAFTPQMIRNPDGSVTSSITPGVEGIQKGAADNYEKAHQTYDAAQQTKQTLALMEDSFRTLNQTGWSSTGAGAEARLGLAKSINSVWQVLGVQGQDLPFNPNTIASWEDLTKNSTRLGFALARTLGAREAMQIVQGAIKANPSVENTPAGARMVLNAIRQNAERDSDYYEYATRYAQGHGGDLVGAEVAFNRAMPPSLYARRAILQAQRNIPQEAVDALRANSRMADQFDQKYGAGGLAKTFLQQAAP